MENLTKQGYQHLRSEEYEEAEKAFDEAVREAPQNASAWNGLGLSLSRNEKHEEALASFKKAYELEPASRAISNNYLKALIARKRFRAAIDIFLSRKSLLPYGNATRIMQMICTSDIGRQSMESKGVLKPFYKLLKQMNITPHENLINTYVFTNFLFPDAPWREKSLLHSTPEMIDRWVTWNGLENLEMATADGKGAILLYSHVAMGRIPFVLLLRNGYRLATIEAKNRLSDYGIDLGEHYRSIQMDINSELHFKQVLAARRLLKKGYILQLAGDGHQGADSIDINFLNRPRAFRTGFARLAISAEVPVLPIFVSMRLSGKITIQINPPIEQPEIVREQKIEHMVREYATTLEKYWLLDPGNLSYQHIVHYLDQEYDSGMLTN